MEALIVLLINFLGVSANFGCMPAGAQKVCFEDLSIDIFLEVQNETCS